MRLSIIRRSAFVTPFVSSVAASFFLFALSGQPYALQLPHLQLDLPVIQVQSKDKVEKSEKVIRKKKPTTKSETKNSTKSQSTTKAQSTTRTRSTTKTPAKTTPKTVQSNSATTKKKVVKQPAVKATTNNAPVKKQPSGSNVQRGSGTVTKGGGNPAPASTGKASPTVSANRGGMTAAPANNASNGADPAPKPVGTLSQPGKSNTLDASKATGKSQALDQTPAKSKGGDGVESAGNAGIMVRREPKNISDGDTGRGSGDTPLQQARETGPLGYIEGKYGKDVLQEIYKNAKANGVPISEALKHTTEVSAKADLLGIVDEKLVKKFIDEVAKDPSRTGETKAALGLLLEGRYKISSKKIPEDVNAGLYDKLARDILDFEAENALLGDPVELPKDAIENYLRVPNGSILEAERLKAVAAAFGVPLEAAKKGYENATGRELTSTQLVRIIADAQKKGGAYGAGYWDNGTQQNNSGGGSPVAENNDAAVEARTGDIAGIDGTGTGTGVGGSGDAGAGAPVKSGADVANNGGAPDAAAKISAGSPSGGQSGDQANNQAGGQGGIPGGDPSTSGGIGAGEEAPETSDTTQVYDWTVVKNNDDGSFTATQGQTFLNPDGSTEYANVTQDTLEPVEGRPGVYRDPETGQEYSSFNDDGSPPADGAYGTGYDEDGNWILVEPEKKNSGEDNGDEGGESQDTETASNDTSSDDDSSSSDGGCSQEGGNCNDDSDASDSDETTEQAAKKEEGESTPNPLNDEIGSDSGALAAATGGRLGGGEVARDEQGINARKCATGCAEGGGESGGPLKGPSGAGVDAPNEIDRYVPTQQEIEAALIRNGGGVTDPPETGGSSGGGNPDGGGGGIDPGNGVAENADTASPQVATQQIIGDAVSSQVQNSLANILQRNLQAEIETNANR